MDYFTALDAVIRRGITAARESYKDAPHKLEGSVAGFRACQNKIPEELDRILTQAHQKTVDARHKSNDGIITSSEYWKTRCYEAEVEWVCNCVSVMLLNQGVKSPFPKHIGPTARAAILVSKIVGVNSSN